MLRNLTFLLVLTTIGCAGNERHDTEMRAIELPATKDAEILPRTTPTAPPSQVPPLPPLRGPVAITYVPTTHFSPEFSPGAFARGFLTSEELASPVIDDLVQSQFAVASYLRANVTADDEVMLEALPRDLPTSDTAAERALALVKRAYPDGFPETLDGVNTVLKASVLAMRGGAFVLHGTGALPTLRSPATSAQELEGIDSQIGMRLAELGGRFDPSDSELRRLLVTERHRALRRKVDRILKAKPGTHRVFVVFGACHDFSDVFSGSAQWSLETADIPAHTTPCT